MLGFIPPLPNPTAYTRSLLMIRPTPMHKMRRDSHLYTSLRLHFHYSDFASVPTAVSLRTRVQCFQSHIYRSHVMLYRPRSKVIITPALYTPGVSHRVSRGYLDLTKCPRYWLKLFITIRCHAT